MSLPLAPLHMNRFVVCFFFLVWFGFVLFFVLNIIFTYLSCCTLISNEIMNFPISFQIFTWHSVPKASDILESWKYFYQLQACGKKTVTYPCCASLRPIENLYTSNIDLLRLQGSISICLFFFYDFRRQIPIGFFTL